MKPNCSRREFLGAMSMVAGAAAARPLFASSMQAPASRVAIGLCPEYDRRVGDSLAVMFDQLGGLERLVPPMRYSLYFALPSGNVWVCPTSMPVFGSPIADTSGMARAGVLP